MTDLRANSSRTFVEPVCHAIEDDAAPTVARESLYLSILVSGVLQVVEVVLLDEDGGLGVVVTGGAGGGGPRSYLDVRSGFYAVVQGHKGVRSGERKRGKTFSWIFEML